MFNDLSFFSLSVAFWDSVLIAVSEMLWDTIWWLERLILKGIPISLNLR